MKSKIKFLLYSLLFGLTSVSAQNSSNKGTDFWIGFPAHGDGSNAGMYFYITSDSSTSGTVSVPGQSWSKSFTVTANQMTLVNIPASVAYVSCTDCIQSKGIHVVSQKKIVMYSHIYYQYRSDATLVLPTAACGKEYYAMAYDQIGPTTDRSQFMIIANQDDTKVKITPTVPLGGGHAAGTPYTITLDEGEVYQGRANTYTQDVTGTHIEVIDTGSTANCRTVALFSGSSNSFIGCSPNGGIASRDNLYQQLYPTRSWGTKYVTIPFKGRSFDEFSICASEDNTSILIYKPTGTPQTFYLNQGEILTSTSTNFIKDVNVSLYIVANKPICVAQYQISQKCGGKGDPSMTILSPIEQTLKEITVYSSQYEDIDDHYINVIIPNSGVNSFRIDGNTASFTKVPKLASYSYAQITVTKGNHHLVSDVGFIAIAYGFGDYESYGYAAGANVKDLTAKLELVNSAQNDISSLCLGDSAELEGQAEYTVSKWVWDFGDGTSANGQYQFHTFKDTGTYTVKLYTYKTNFDGCSTYDSSDLEIRVNMPPTSNFGTSLRCEANTIQFWDSSAPPPGEQIQARQWIFHNSSTYATNTSKYYDTAGTYKVAFVVKTEAQCYDTIKWDMVVNPNPVPGINLDDLCFKDTAYISNITTVKTGKIASNKWYFGDGDSSTAYHPKHFYADSGTYYITLQTETDSGCAGSIMDTVYKHPKFTMDFKHTDTCAGFALNFINKSTTTAGTLGDFIWDFPGGTQFTTTDAQFQFPNPGSYKVKLTGTQDNYCTDSSVQTVIVDPLVAASFTTSGKCMGDSVRFTNTSTVASGSVATVTWSLDNGITRSGNKVSVKYPVKGTKNIQMIAKSDAGCSDTATTTITVYDPRISSLSFPTVCLGDNAKMYGVYSLDSDSLKTYDWNIDGFTASTDTIYFTSNNVGVFHANLKVTTKYGCTLSKLDSFKVYDVPVAGFTVKNVCEGYSLAPVNTTTIGHGETISSYAWDFNGNKVSTVQNPTIVATPAGSSTLKLSVVSNHGCKNELTKNFEIYPVPNAGFTYSDTCLGLFTNFNDYSSISGGSISGYNWTYSDGQKDAGTSVARLYGSDGAYSVMLKVISDKGCSDSITRNFNIAPKPNLDFLITPTQGCQPVLVNVTNNSTINSGVITNYSWDWGDGNTGSGSSPSHVYTSDGLYQIVVYGTSNSDCKDTFTAPSQINVLPAPVADFTYDPLEPSLLFPDVNFTDASSPDVVSFYWETGDGSTYTTQNVYHTYAGAGDYNVVLIATAGNGCKDTATQPVHVKLDFFIWIPTVFSPNDDGLNDVFRIHGIFNEVQGYSLQIFNRWGQVVFESENTDEVWDGTYQGVPVPAGNYGYKVRYINYETHLWDGHIGTIKVLR
ncbi:MAG: PKD domain-containing protein [Bacteroidetes bacterium]|nr:PKD domain-containing protein [Bacteroidota bacterium]